MDITQAIKDRFHDKYQVLPNGCWQWTAASRGNGYGALKIDGKVHDAHRVSYLIHKGAIADDLLVMHSCDNRGCVNPAHLKAGTYSDNHNDAIAKGRLTPYKKTRTEPLTEAELASLRKDYVGGVSKKVLASKYKVAQTSLTRLLKGLG